MRLKEQHIIRKTLKICFGIFTLLLLILFIWAGIKTYVDHKKLQTTVVENNSIINKITGKKSNDKNEEHLSIPNEILASAGMTELEVRELVNNMFDENGNMTQDGQEFKEIIEKTIVENNEFITYEQVDDHSDEIESMMRELAGLKHDNGNLDGKIDDTEDAFSDIVDEMKKNLGDSMNEKDKANNERMDSMEAEFGNKTDSMKIEIEGSISKMDEEINSKMDENTASTNEKFAAIENNFNIFQENFISYKLEADKITKDILDKISILSAEDISYDKTKTEHSVNARNVQEAIDELGKSVGDGKEELANAITMRYEQASQSPEVSLSGNSSFAELSNAIKKIPMEIKIEGNPTTPKIKYIYHHHLDENENFVCGIESKYYRCDEDVRTTAEVSGGCYTKAVYHSHGSNCYSSCRHPDQYVSAWTDSGSDGRSWASCSRCGQCYATTTRHNASENGYPFGTSAARDGLHGDRYIGTYLSCTKEAGSLEYYTLGCNLVENQIVKAEIDFVE